MIPTHTPEKNDLEDGEKAKNTNIQYKNNAKIKVVESDDEEEEATWLRVLVITLTLK